MSTWGWIRPALALLVTACNAEVEHASGPAGSSGSGQLGGQGGQTAAAASSAGGADTSSSSISAGGGCLEPSCQPFAACPGHECADCLDNDGDGAIDMRSPHCLTPCDGSESGFAGVPATGNFDPCKRDCSFDEYAGSGNDGCEYNLGCDPLGPGGAECTYDPGKVCPPRSRKCLDFCLPRTPNGCDCFGCCELPPASGEFRLTGNLGYPGCSVSDPSSCMPCTPVEDCYNPCEPCEVCAGTTSAPTDCAMQACPGDAAACGQPCQPACPRGSFCQTGCCVVF